MLLLVVAGSTLALSALNSRPGPQIQRQRDVHLQLQRARDALLAYAAHSAALHANSRGPGFLPCPVTTLSDPDGDGIVVDNSTTDCAGYDSVTTPLIGRLPLAIDAAGTRYELTAYDRGIDQQFWYAVGNRYVAISPATAPNTPLRSAVLRTSATLADATSVRLSLDGTVGYVALIIAPGDALDQQNRPAAPDDHEQYLDQINGDGYGFISRFPANPAAFNDQLLGITLDEYMRAVGLPVMTAIKQQLDAYYPGNGNRYPASPGYTNFPLEPAEASSQTEFLAIFASIPATAPVWLRSSVASPPAQGNGENWSDFSYYLQVNDSRAQLAFAGCAGMVYTLDYAGGITRSGDTC